MMNMLSKVEIRKSLKEERFLLVCVIGIILGLVHAVWSYYNIYRVGLAELDYVKIMTDFNHEYFPVGTLQVWLGTEFASPYNRIYINVFPLMATIPFTTSFINEWKNGYSIQIVTRIGRTKYLLSKIIANLFVAGISVVIPLITSFLCVIMYVPIRGIDPMSMHGIGGENYMFCKQFFENPVLYVILYLMIDIMCGGVYATLSLFFSTFTDNRFIIISIPFILQVFTSYIITTYNNSFSYNPENIINPLQPVPGCKPSVVIIACVCLIVLFGLGFVILNRKSDNLRGI